MVTTFAMSAFAQQADKSTPANRTVVVTYADFNRHHAAGIAGHYTKDGMLVSPTAKIVKTGRQEIEQSHPGLFKMDMYHGQIAVEAFPLGTDAAMYLGEYHLTGEGQSGTLKVDGHYTAVAVHESGTCKGR